MHRHLFQNKDVLDIGCNVGHISIAVARTLGAKTVVGIDIDSVLIGMYYTILYYNLLYMLLLLFYTNLYLSILYLYLYKPY